MLIVFNYIEIFITILNNIYSIQLYRNCTTILNNIIFFRTINCT